LKSYEIESLIFQTLQSRENIMKMKTRVSDSSAAVQKWIVVLIL